MKKEKEGAPMIDTKKLKELEAAATPGPWYQCGCRYSIGSMDLNDKEVLDVFETGIADATTVERATADNEFICAMRNALPALLDRVEELERSIEAEYENEVAWLAEHRDQDCRPNYLNDTGAGVSVERDHNEATRFPTKKACQEFLDFWKMGHVYEPVEHAWVRRGGLERENEVLKGAANVDRVAFSALMKVKSNEIASLKTAAKERENQYIEGRESDNVIIETLKAANVRLKEKGDRVAKAVNAFIKCTDTDPAGESPEELAQAFNELIAYGDVMKESVRDWEAERG